MAFFCYLRYLNQKNAAGPFCAWKGDDMKKKYLLIFGIITVFLFSGCASLKCLDGSCERQIKELTVTGDEQKKEIAKLDAENKAKEKMISAKQEELAKLQAEKDALSSKLKDIEDQALKAQKEKEAQAIKSENLTEKQAAPKAEGAMEAEGKPLKIKVLAGDGRLASARAMARRIEKGGLKVELVDLAPRADFSADTVFYLPDSEKAAKDLARSLGEKTRVKPLTWSSAFNIIVVTGKKKK